MDFDKVQGLSRQRASTQDASDPVNHYFENSVDT